MAKKKEKKAGKRMKKSELAERLINYFRAKPMKHSASNSSQAG